MALFTSEQIEAFKDAFHRFDADANGRINGRELSMTMKSLGYNPVEADAQDLTLGVGEDDPVLISFDEFVRMLARSMGHTD